MVVGGRVDGGGSVDGAGVVGGSENRVFVPISKTRPNPGQVCFLFVCC